MKKILAIILSMLFVLGFAASAFAVHADIPSETQAVVAGSPAQITLSGELRVRYDWQHATFVDGAPDKSYANERVRLGLEAKVSPNTTGMIQLSSYNGGGTPDSDNLTVGTGGSGNAGGTSQATGIYKAGNEFKGSLTIRQMWIMNSGTGLLGIPAGIKIGHMPLILGSGLFYDHTYYGDDALVLFAMPVKELELDLVTIKFRESSISSTAVSNQSNAYAFIANYKASKDTGVSFDATYVDDQNSLANLTTYTAGAMNPDTHLWNFGLRGNTAVEGFRLKLDGEVQTGSVSDTGGSNIDFSGYALQAGAGYTLDPVKLDLEFGYGSGDSGKDANKVKTFVTSQGPESTFGDPYRANGLQGPYVYNYRTINATGNQYGGLANTWYLRLGGNADLSKDWNLDMAIFYLQAVDAITTSNVGLYNTLSGGTPFSTTNVSAKGYSPSKSIGTELDARLTYQIDKGLRAWVEGGYLWAGDFWRAASTVTSGTKPANAYTMREGIQLNF